MTKGKKIIKIRKFYLNLLPPLSSQDGGIVAKEIYIDTWVSGQRVTKRGKMREGGGSVATSHPLLRERVMYLTFQRRVTKKIPHISLTFSVHAFFFYKNR